MQWRVDWHFGLSILNINQPVDATYRRPDEWNPEECKLGVIPDDLYELAYLAQLSMFESCGTTESCVLVYHPKFTRGDGVT